MSLGLDDKLLGERVHNYCSSSEDEGDDKDSDMEEGGGEARVTEGASMPNFDQYQGHCTNTGPKGVINDWREFKRLETEKKEENEIQRLALAKKLTLTCRSYMDDEKEKKEDEEFLEQLEEMKDDFLEEYRKRRIEEMRKALENVPKFGKVCSLTGADFADSIDKESPRVTILVHVYEEGKEACVAMNGCFSCLAKEYPTIKFCKITASEACLSINFAKKGVPAILIYKNKQLVGNFVRVSEDLGEDFFAVDVESFLQEHGFLLTNETGLELPFKVAAPSMEDDSGSDFDLD